MFRKVAVVLFVLCAAQANPDEQQSSNHNEPASNVTIYDSHQIDELNNFVALSFLRQWQRNEGGTSCDNNDKPKPPLKCKCAEQHFVNLGNVFQKCSDIILQTIDQLKGSDADNSHLNGIKKCNKQLNKDYKSMLSHVKTDNCPTALELFNNWHSDSKPCQEKTQKIDAAMMAEIVKRMTDAKCFHEHGQAWNDLITVFIGCNPQSPSRSSSDIVTPEVQNKTEKPEEAKVPE